jgi:hypothetical protein
MIKHRGIRGLIWALTHGDQVTIIRKLVTRPSADSPEPRQRARFFAANGQPQLALDALQEHMAFIRNFPSRPELEEDRQQLLRSAELDYEMIKLSTDLGASFQKMADLQAGLSETTLKRHYGRALRHVKYCLSKVQKFHSRDA